MFYIKIELGGLAVLETAYENVGNVIKRVFSHTNDWTPISPNLVYLHEPITLPLDKIIRVWPLCGVLFEVRDAVFTAE